MTDELRLTTEEIEAVPQSCCWDMFARHHALPAVLDAQVAKVLNALAAERAMGHRSSDCCGGEPCTNSTCEKCGCREAGNASFTCFRHRAIVRLGDDSCRLKGLCMESGAVYEGCNRFGMCQCVEL